MRALVLQDYGVGQADLGGKRLELLTGEIAPRNAAAIQAQPVVIFTGSD